ncbi:MAG: integration host factor subunit alpha [Geobacteraceae bacterium]|jgi:integration host factor subunit alpha
MTKADLADKVYEKLSCTKDEAFELVQLTLEVLKESIMIEGKVKIGGFGSFAVRKKAARIGRNPFTGETITIAPRKVLIFKPSPVLKNLINQG